jgi:hypothetical protein
VSFFDRIGQSYSHVLHINAQPLKNGCNSVLICEIFASFRFDACFFQLIGKDKNPPYKAIKKGFAGKKDDQAQ